MLKYPLANTLTGPFCGQITLCRAEEGLKKEQLTAACSERQGVARLYCHIHYWQHREPKMTAKLRCVHVKGEAPVEWKVTGTGRVRALGRRVGECLTSDNGQLCRDRHLSLAVACHTLVGVLISGCSEWLDPQHSACTLVKLHRLDGHRTTQTEPSATASDVRALLLEN